MFTRLVRGPLLNSTADLLDQSPSLGGLLSGHRKLSRHMRLLDLVVGTHCWFYLFNGETPRHACHLQKRDLSYWV